jgi:hypothetical protein
MVKVKKMRYSKIGKIVILSLILFPFYPLMVKGADPDNPRQFGYGAEDGSAIQCFVVEEVALATQDRKINVLIPQEEPLLEYDFFWLYIYIPEGGERIVEFSYYEEDIEKISGWKLLDAENISFTGRMNVWGDPFMVMIKFDSSYLSSFTQTDIRRRFDVKYLDVEFSFEHLTNPALVIEPIQRGELTGTIFFYVFISLMLFTGSVFVSSRVKNREGTWMEFDLTSVLLISTWLLVGSILFMFLQGATESDIIRQAVQIPVITVSFIFCVILGLWIPSFFTEELTEVHIIKYDPLVDVTDLVRSLLFGSKIEKPEKLIEIGHERLHLVKSPMGRKYYENARSFVQILGSIIHGATALINAEKCYSVEVTVPSETDDLTYRQRFKRLIKRYLGEKLADDDFGFHLRNSEMKKELIFVKEFEWKKSTYKGTGLLNNIIRDRKIVSLLFVVGLLLMFVLFTVLKVNIETIGLFAFIFSMMYIGYYIYDYTRQYRYLSLTPISRNVIELIIDSKRAEIMEEAAQDRIASLINERDQLGQKLITQEAIYEGKRIAEWENLLSGSEEASELKTLLNILQKDPKAIEEMEKKDAKK